MSVNDLLAGDEPIISKLSDEIQSPEARCFFGFQMMQKNIHAETLNVLIDLLLSSTPSPTQQITSDILFSTLESLPTTTRRTAWIQKYITDSPYSYSTRLFAVAVYLTLWNSAAQTLLLALCLPKPPSKTAPFQGLAKAIVKVQGDLHRHAQFYRLLASEHCVNAVHVSEAVSMVREAVLIEGSVCEEMMEMGGAGGGKKGVYVAKDVFVGYEQVVGRVERLGRDVLKAFGVRSTLFEGTTKKDSLEWMDQVLWGLVQKDSGVVEHVVSVRDNVKTEERKEKMNVRQEFSLDEDF
ncbi:Ribonucleoside-diphosphate reductase subunit M2 B [Rhizoclosmatium hyalinum]|nr:Ribonucleoside-diphosphate reductase subunit M2 B [Rhizoclosmatium hyalinum]